MSFSYNPMTCSYPRFGQDCSEVYASIVAIRYLLIRIASLIPAVTGIICALFHLKQNFPNITLLRRRSSRNDTHGQRGAVVSRGSANHSSRRRSGPILSVLILVASLCLLMRGIDPNGYSGFIPLRMVMVTAAVCSAALTSLMFAFTILWGGLLTSFGSSQWTVPFGLRIAVTSYMVLTWSVALSCSLITPINDFAAESSTLASGSSAESSAKTDEVGHEDEENRSTNELELQLQTGTFRFQNAALSALILVGYMHAMYIGVQLLVKVHQSFERGLLQAVASVRPQFSCLYKWRESQKLVRCLILVSIASISTVVLHTLRIYDTDSYIGHSWQEYSQRQLHGSLSNCTSHLYTGLKRAGDRQLRVGLRSEFGRMAAEATTSTTAVSNCSNNMDSSEQFDDIDVFILQSVLMLFYQLEIYCTFYCCASKRQRQEMKNEPHVSASASIASGSYSTETQHNQLSISSPNIKGSTDVLTPSRKHCNALGDKRTKASLFAKLFPPSSQDQRICTSSSISSVSSTSSIPTWSTSEWGIESKGKDVWSTSGAGPKRKCVLEGGHRLTSKENQNSNAFTTETFAQQQHGPFHTPLNARDDTLRGQDHILEEQASYVVLQSPSDELNSCVSPPGAFILASPSKIWPFSSATSSKGRSHRSELLDNDNKEVIGKRNAKASHFSSSRFARSELRQQGVIATQPETQLLYNSDMCRIRPFEALNAGEVQTCGPISYEDEIFGNSTFSFTPSSKSCAGNWLRSMSMESRTYISENEDDDAEGTKAMGEELPTLDSILDSLENLRRSDDGMKASDSPLSLISYNANNMETAGHCDIITSYADIATHDTTSDERSTRQHPQGCICQYRYRPSSANYSYVRSHEEDKELCRSLREQSAQGGIPLSQAYMSNESTEAAIAFEKISLFGEACSEICGNSKEDLMLVSDPTNLTHEQIYAHNLASLESAISYNQPCDTSEYDSISDALEATIEDNDLLASWQMKVIL